MNCGGGGQLAAPASLTSRKELTSPRLALRPRRSTSKKRPDTWRLACQTIVGGQNLRLGDLGVRTMYEAEELT